MFQCTGILNATDWTIGNLNETMYQSHQSQLIFELPAEATSLW